MRRTATLLPALLLPGLALAWDPPLDGPLSPPDGGATGIVDLSIGDGGAPPGAVVTIPFDAHTDLPFEILTLAIDFDPTALLFVGIRPAAGLETYADLNGEPVCDVVIYPSGRLQVLFLTEGSYSSDICGDSLVFLDFLVATNEVGATALTLVDALEQVVDTAAAHVLPPGTPERIAGDGDADGAVGLADAIALLAHLFVGGAPLACAAAADLDADGALGIADALALLGGLFGGGELAEPLCAYPLAPSPLPCAATACP